MRGKTVIVTGTGGIGYEIALSLAARGASVILAGRDAEKGGQSVQNIRDACADADIRFEKLDLADMNSVADFCERMKTRLSALDILMNIAGLMMPDDLQLTDDGVEIQFAVNYLSAFALTARLFPLLCASCGARVVTISSLANRPARFDLADARAARGYSSSVSYALSKLCCLMFAIELSARAAENGWRVSAYGAHPGLAKTRLFSRSRGFTMALLRTVFFIFPFIRQSAANAAAPALFAATSPKARSGGYYGPWFLFMGPPRRALVPLRAKNRALRRALWELSVSLTGVDIS